VITVRSASERHCLRRPNHATWLTFRAQDPRDPLAAGFGALEQLAEHRLARGASLPLRAARDVEIISYVLEGTLARRDASGRAAVVQTGEFQRVTGARAVHGRERSSARGGSARVFQLVFSPTGPPLARSLEQQRFSTAERRGRLRLVAAAAGRAGTLPLARDALLYSAVLEPGQHLVHALQPRRAAWLHVVRGAIALGDLRLTAGDAVGVSDELAVSFTAIAVAEVLLLDLAAPIAPPSKPARRR
jgi:quercetin 2,3-dioxygenase